MRKFQKRKIKEFLKVLNEVHKEVQKKIRDDEKKAAMELLISSQEGAIKIGELIENTEGAHFITISLLEDYCECVYSLYQKLEEKDKQLLTIGNLQKQLRKIEKSVDEDIKITYEIAFMPYKASMWDSLESIWIAAKKDSLFQTYVVPIPYYDKNPDGTLGEIHEEGNDFPQGVPIVDYKTYHIEERKPDVIYIHNPYDDKNFVTNIDKKYYSHELKKHTNLLIYVPYYATSGGMSKSLDLCPAYINADYIVIQKDYFKQFFHSSIPKEKFLPFGSPKFDKILHACEEPVNMPDLWKEQTQGKKVYFYNTSLSGMLNDTRNFLLKMEYVFKCFQVCENACVLWRPHPLMDSTFIALRKEFYPYYLQLKQYFIQNKAGIYDDTPEITSAIALSDAYIGDEGTSITSLFGVAGKPIFILNNSIHTLPEEEDWRGEMIKDFYIDGYDEWRVIHGNKLYYSKNKDYKYSYYCDLSDYTFENQYERAMEIEGKIYICPKNAQDILIVSNHKIQKRISLKQFFIKPGAGTFAYSIYVGAYIFIIPLNYPAIVRLDCRKDTVEYYYDWKEFFCHKNQEEIRIGGICKYKEYLILSSPVKKSLVVIHTETMEYKRIDMESKNYQGCVVMIAKDSDIWLLPSRGHSIIKWNFETHEEKEYAEMPKGFQCGRKTEGLAGDALPFSNIIFYKNKIILSPYFGNMFVMIDEDSGEASEWKFPMKLDTVKNNGYFVSQKTGTFLTRTDSLGEWTYRYYYEQKRELYDVNIETKEYKEIEIVFSKEELQQQASGYINRSESLRYVCEENAFCTLLDFLTGEMIGEKFSREKQKKIYEEIAENTDGTCGDKTHTFIRNLVKMRGENDD